MRLCRRPAIKLKGDHSTAQCSDWATCFSGNGKSQAKFKAVQGDNADPSLSALAVRTVSSKCRIS